ncbi:hypothetical protein C8Q74DRAFT_761101 [Fomes fomentarius]|nr:hypothetical protein C8Q74DRAFT_761101 [Fomes fomentarius]
MRPVVLLFHDYMGRISLYISSRLKFRHIAADMLEEISVQRSTFTECDYSPVIFTGQPGIGKTAFLLYLLIRLLQHDQVVLLTLLPKSPLLFYRGRVWEAKRPPTKRMLPKRSGNAFIWSLFEANKGDLAQTVYANNGRLLFPVQTPSVYEGWSEIRNPVVRAFPLWEPEELKQGLKLHDEFAPLRRELRSMLKTWPDRSRDSSFDYSGALQVLRAACGDEWPVSVDMVLDVLLDASITAFGCVARDVYNAILHPNSVFAAPTDADELDYDDLKKIVDAIGHLSFLGPRVPHDVVSIRPLTKVGEPVEWSIDFKSDMIAEKISEKWADAQDGRVREFIAYLSSVPAGKPFVGWLFKSLAHRCIEAADDTRAYWPLRPMTLEKPSNFVLDISAQSIPMIPKRNQRRVTFDMESITGERLVLRDDEYYVPTIHDFPLIDSFVVSFKRGSSAAAAPSADLWLFQMTTSARHRDLSTGYAMIRNIVSILQKQLCTQSSDDQPPKKRRKPDARHTPPVVRVHYVLACPVGEGQIERWTLPTGWAANTRGDAYLMEIDVLK